MLHYLSTWNYEKVNTSLKEASNQLMESMCGERRKEWNGKEAGDVLNYLLFSFH